MAERTIASPHVQLPATTERTRQHERFMTPAVDIYETPEGLVVLADVPGVAPEGLEVRVDNHILTIRGQVRHPVAGAVLYQEYELVNFFRQFTLSDQVDQNRITADLQCGVLTLQLPKAAETPPRRIEVRVD